MRKSYRLPPRCHLPQDQVWKHFWKQTTPGGKPSAMQHDKNGNGVSQTFLEGQTRGLHILFPQFPHELSGGTNSRQQAIRHPRFCLHSLGIQPVEQVSARAMQDKTRPWRTPLRVVSHQQGQSPPNTRRPFPRGRLQQSPPQRSRHFPPQPQRKSLHQVHVPIGHRHLHLPQDQQNRRKSPRWPRRRWAQRGRPRQRLLRPIQRIHVGGGSCGPSQNIRPLRDCWSVVGIGSSEIVQGRRPLIAYNMPRKYIKIRQLHARVPFR